MYTYNHAIYMVLDFLKISSDDAYYTPDHVAFLLNKYRAYVLKTKYEDTGKTPSDDNYQTLNLKFEVTDKIEGFEGSGQYLKSVGKIPSSLNIGASWLSGADLFDTDLCMVTPVRFRYVGFNKWMRNISYATVCGEQLYIKSCNPSIYMLKEGQFRDIFSDPLEAAAASSDAEKDENGNLCNPFDVEFPLADDLLPLVMQYVVKDLSGGLYKPQDSENNADDDLSKLAQFIRTYIKTPLRRQIE